MRPDHSASFTITAAYHSTVSTLAILRICEIYWSREVFAANRSREVAK